jgi:hypothetical protein
MLAFYRILMAQELTAYRSPPVITSPTPGIKMKEMILDESQST